MNQPSTDHTEHLVQAPRKGSPFVFYGTIAGAVVSAAMLWGSYLIYGEEQNVAADSITSEQDAFGAEGYLIIAGVLAATMSAIVAVNLWQLSRKCVALTLAGDTLRLLRRSGKTAAEVPLSSLAKVELDDVGFDDAIAMADNPSHHGHHDLLLTTTDGRNLSVECPSHGAAKKAMDRLQSLLAGTRRSDAGSAVPSA